MAAIILLLLWFFQFLFFDVLYYKSQINHIKSVSEDLLSKSYGLDKAENWQNFESVAKSQNVEIYIVKFNKNQIKQNGENDFDFPNDTSLSVYTPNYNGDSASISSLGWSKTRITTFLSSIVEMGNKTSSFYFVEENQSSEAITDILIYGGELNGSFGATTQAYMCLIAPISKGNYTILVMRNMLIVASALILVFTIIMAIIYSRRISDPLKRLAGTADHLAKGDFNINFESGSFNEMHQLADSLNFAKEELSKTEQMRRDFIANVSHDLRTPLTMIKAYGEMIRDLSGRNEEKRTKHCQIIIDESNRLSTLVGDIQNLSKLQSGTDTFSITKFDLGELCKTVVNRFSIMSETQGYVFNTECEESSFCQGDYQKIEQVLYNLIGNALNYTGEDKKVTVRCKRVGDSFRAEIIDTGKGISPDEIDSVWERYYRANQKKRNIVGSGLGLNIVKIILDSHNAKYGIVSELDKGTTFWFELPAVEK